MYHWNIECHFRFTLYYQSFDYPVFHLEIEEMGTIREDVPIFSFHKSFVYLRRSPARYAIVNQIGMLNL